MEGFYSKKKKKKKPKKKKLTIIANKFNNHLSIQQSKHYKLQNKTTKKYTPYTHNINIYIYIYAKKKNQMNIEQSNIIYNLNIYIQNYKI